MKKSFYSQLLAAFALLTFSMFSVQAQLSGSYTIGTSGNYASFSAAVSALTTSGVSGPVTFNVASGTYTEQVTIGSITGASATNTITFQSVTGDSSDVVLEYPTSTSSTNNFTLYLNGADFITFKNMTIARTGTNSYAGVIEISDGANNNNFLNNLIIGRDYITSSTNYVLVYSSSSTKDENNIFRYNHFKFGSYAILLDGGSSYYESGNIIENNFVDSFCYYGIKTEYQYGVKINNNIVNSHPGSGTSYGIYPYYSHNCEVKNNELDMQGSSTNYAIYPSYSDSSVEVSYNKINLHGSSTAYGIRFYYCDGLSTHIAKGYNNFISQSVGTGSVYGIYPYNCNYVDIYYNSINITGGSTTAGRALYLNSSSSSYGNINVKNNICVNTGGGYAIELSSGAVSNSYVTSCDYNDLYATGSVLARYNNTDYSSLSAWQTGASLDANSVSANPIFNSYTDLHASSVSLNGAATPITGITVDIDGENRNATTPDIGADEFTPASNDAGIASFETGSVCAGTPVNIQVKVRNYGITAMDSVEIHWTVNDTVQTMFKYRTQIAVGGNAIVTICQMTFYNGNTYNLVFWTEKPNGVTDGDHSNDTTSVLNYKTAMSGTYLIGSSSGADYSTISAAVSDLNNNGVCGPVVFNIESGTYNEQIAISEISGASATNTITFQSLSGDSSTVIITQASSSSSADNYTVKLDGADFITFKNLTLSRTGSDTYCRVLEIDNVATNNLFSHLQFLGGNYSTTSSSSNRASIYSSSGNNDTNNIFEYSYFKDNSYAFYYYGSGSSSLESGTIIRYNFFKDQIYGIYIYYQDAPKIYGNTLDFSTTSTSYPIRPGYCDNELEVYNNTITTAANSYGIYIYYCDADTLQEGMIYNNAVHVNVSGTYYGIYNYSSTHQKYYYNSVNITGSGSSSRAFYAYSSSSHHVYTKNNNFVNNADGYAYYISSATIQESDYNNLYTTGTNIGYDGSDQTTLTAFQSSTGMETNSVSANPGYVSASDLHSKSSGINNQGTPIAGITTDMDGETRNTSTPDIGADEFTPPANDLSVIGIISPTVGCGDSFSVITVVVKNFGTNSISSLPVKVDITGGTTTSYNQTFTQTLTTNSFDTFSFTSTLNTYAGDTFHLAAYTQLSGDQDKTNDTIFYSFIHEGIPAGPTTINATICEGNSAQLIANASANMNVNWYDALNGGNLISTGDTLNLSSVNSTTTYYANATAQQSYSIGAVDTSIGSFSNFTNAGGHGLLFTVYQTIVLDSVTVYPNASGDVIFRLRDASNTSTISSITRSVSVNYGVRVYVGMTIYPGTYRLDGDGSTTGGLVRNSTGGNYPYEIPGVISITGNSFDPDYYYFFYDWKITTSSCPSPRLPATVTVIPNPTVDAGLSDSICVNSTFTTNASGSNYSSLRWYSNGDGTFNATNTLTAVYTPGTNDNSNGSVKLYLEATGNSPCGLELDSLELTILGLPAANAGVDTTICENSTYTLDGMASDYSSIAWTSAGTGSFSNTASLNAVYTPSSSDISSGSIELYLTATSDCGSDKDTMVISFGLLPTASAGNDDSVCVTSTYTLNGSATNYDNATWTTSGDGTFNNANNLMATYTLGTNDMSGNSVQLILVAAANTPCSDNAYDTMMLYIIPEATVNAGNDVTICVNEDVTLSGVATNYNQITWSTLGDGSFANSNNLSTTYTPGTSDITNGMFNLILTVNPISPCSVILTDTIRVDVQPLPSVDAGIDDTICSNDVSNLAATGQHYASVNWTTTGDGSFNSNSSLTTVYTPGNMDIANGMVKIYITANGITPCSGNTMDSVMIYIQDAATVDAGSDFPICKTSPATLSATASNYQSFIWLSLGDGTFDDASLLTATYTPGNSDIAAGSVNLVAKASPIAPCMGDIYDTIIISIEDVATIDAGSDLNICAGTNATINATAANYTAIKWSANGDGSFDNTNSLSIVYTPGTNDLISGNFKLYVEVTGSGSCGNGYDTVAVTIDYPAVITSVETPDSTCGGEVFMPVATATNYANLLWSTNGDGNFDDNTMLAPGYTHGTNDLANGMVTLTLTADNNNSCSSVSEDIELYIIAKPQIDLGADQTIFSHNSIKLDAGAGFDKYLWSTNEQTQTISVDSSGNVNMEKTVWAMVTKDGCSNADTIIITFEDSTSSIDELANIEMKVYPNPTSGKLMFEMEGDGSDISIQIISMEGKLLENKLIENIKGKYIEEFDLSAFAKGIYTIKVFNKNGFVTERIVLK